MATPEFQPQISELQTRQFVNHYQKYPHLYDEDRQHLIEVHASHYKLPFLKQHTTGVTGLVQQAASGFFSGITTFNVGDPPKSTAEGIARSAGHLAGFAGIVPLAPLKAMGAVRMATALGGAPAKYAMHGLSIPMLLSKQATLRAKKLVTTATKTAVKGRADATNTAAGYLTKRRLGDIAEGAFNLGVASSISSWQGGVDEMVNNAIHGAEAGAAFKVIGNFLKMKNPRGEKMLRAVAGSMYMGMPATFRGATTPEQVYEYLLGGYFGFKEGPVERRMVGEHISKMFKAKTIDPEQVKGWENLPADVQKDVKKKTETIFSKEVSNVFGNILVKGLDAETYEKIIQANVPEGFEVKGVDKETGEPILELKPELKELEKKIAKDELPAADESPFETSQSSEFTVPSTQPILQRSVNFVERKLRTRLEKIEKDSGLNAKILEIKRQAEKIDLSIEEFTAVELAKEKHSERINYSEEIVNKLQDNMGISFTLEDKGFVRQHVMNKLHGVPSVIYSGEVTEAGVEARRLPNNMTQLGNQRGNKEPLKAIELAYINAWEREGGVLPGEEPVIMLTGATRGHGFKSPGHIGRSAIDKLEFMHKDTEIHVGDEPTGADRAFQDYLKMMDFTNVTVHHGQLNPRYNAGFKTEFTKGGYKAKDKTMLDRATGVIGAEKLGPSSSRYVKAKPYVKRKQKEFVGDTGQYSLKKGGRPLAIHDHFTFRNPDGKLIELEFNDYFSHLKKNFDYDERRATDIYIDHTGKIISDMASKGFYYLGGRGDNQRNYFIKKHPSIKINKETGELTGLKELKKQLNISYLKNKKKGFLKMYEAFRKEWGRTYGYKFGKDAGKMFDRMFMNNVLYETEMNGMPLEPGFKNVGKLIAQGFINNPIDFNKRMQIWMTNGIPGDVKFLRDKLDAISDIPIRYEKSTKRRTGKDALTDDIVPAFIRTYPDGRKEIFIDKEEMRKKYDEKAWTKPKVKGVKAIPENQFKTYEEFERFAIEHERAHARLPERGENETYGQYENRMNKAALSYDKLSYIITPDAPPSKKNKNTIASAHKEATDGGIIMHDAYLDALAEMYGIAEGTAENNVGHLKSFIVSQHPELGALLGKYMIHGAGKEQSAVMDEAGIQMQIYKSSAKQMGNRKFNEIYEMSIEDMKGVLSERSDSHSIEPQRIPKQMFSNLTAFSPQMPDSKKNLGVINKMIDEFIVESFNGDSVYNSKLMELRSNPSNKNLMEEVLSNLESVGVTEFMAALQDPKMAGFSARAYQKILRVASETIDHAISEGELSDIQGESQSKEIYDFKSKLERMSRNSEPDKIGPYIHKYSVPMLNAIKRAYVVTRVTRPKVKNSLAARMRPYDEFLQKKFPELEKDDTIFFLDEGFRNMKIEHERLESWDKDDRTLGKVWDAYVATKKGTSKAFKGQEGVIEEFLSGISMRVPMDSKSGAQKLSFKGFTGRKGYGILQHPRTMRAEGGADLDGDKSWVFFGWKPEYKELYHAHKEEYYNKDGTIADAKTDIVRRGLGEGTMTYREKFIKVPSFFEQEMATKLKVEDADLYRQDILKFFPNARKAASDGASRGRSMLGPAVILKNTVQAAHSAIMASPGKAQIISEPTSKGGRYEIHLSAKTDPKDWDHFNRVSRAEIALAADPMDEAGLAKYETFLLESVKSLFHARGEWINKNGKRKPMDIDSSAMLLRKGLIQLASDVNKAYWGKSRVTNKNYTSGEMRDLVEKIKDLPDEQANSYLFRVGKLLEPVDFSEGIFNRISKDKLLELYKDYGKDLSGLIDTDLFQRFQSALGRQHMSVPYRDALDVVFTHKLWSNTMRKLASEDSKIFDEMVRKEKYREKYIKKYGKEYYDKISKDTGWRKGIVDDYYGRMEDYIVNDITDMVTFRNIWNMFEKGDVPLSKIEEMSKFVEKAKSTSYLAFMKNKEAMKYKEDVQDPEAFAVQQQIKKLAIEEKVPEVLAFEEGVEVGKPISRAMTQNQVDQEVLRYKHNLSSGESEIFDALMLGSLTRDKGRTETSALGLSSVAIPDSSIRTFMKEFNNTFEKSEDKVLYNEGKKEVAKIAETTDKTALEEPSEIIDELAPFKGLQEGTLKEKEHKEMLMRIKDNLNFFHNAVGKSIDIEARSPKKELNLFLRAMVEKDINAMNMEDWRVFDNMLVEMRRGPGIARLYKKIVGNEKKLPKWWHWAFPRTVSRDMIKDDLLLLEESGVYFTDKGVEATGPILEPYSTLTALQKYIVAANDASSNSYIKLRNKFDEDFQYIDGLENGAALWEIAIRKMEMGQQKDIHRDHGNSGIGNKYKSNYSEALSKAQKKHNWKLLKGKIFNVPGEGGKREKLTGQQVIDNIKNKMSEKNKYIFDTLIQGDKKYFDMFVAKDSRGNAIWRNRDANDFMIDIGKFVKFITDSYRKGEPIPEDMGLDFLRKVAREMQIKQAQDMGNLEFAEKLWDNPIKETQARDFDSYYPHLMMDKKVSKENIKKSYEIIMASGVSKEEKIMQVKHLVMKYHNNTGEWTMEMTDNQHWELWDKALGEIGEGRKKESIKTLDSLSKPGNLHHRTGHNAGWSVDPMAYHSYMKSVLDSYHRQVGQIVSRDNIDKFYKKNYEKLGEDITGAWQQYLMLYVQDSMGYPSVIPRYAYENKALNVKGTPYYWFADNIVLEKLNKFKKGLGIKPKEKVPEELRNITISDIRTWTNLEAKFELMSLLAHPKTAVGNLYGGTTHTIASTGLKNFRRGRDIGWLQTHLNPDFKTKQDLWEFASMHGVVEDFLIKEANFSPEAKNIKFMAFVKDATSKIRKDPEFSDSSLMGLAKQHGVSDSIFQKAAWFMRSTERILRRDAFMAHLVQAWKDFGRNLPYDHPFLIKKAKKGVQATQFLYSAPFRPAFSRTALGKVMTRFQLWAWNAVDFRKETYRQAAIRGYREGTPEFERLKRLMAMDMLMLGLGSIFTYSIFEAALPAPYNWLQDTAGLLFGDEKERDRAFFGAWPTPLAPLQLITPPIARLPVQSFTAAINGSWDKVATYTLPTMFPFGRMARDVWGVYKNPMFYAEKFTGFPVLQLQREVKKERDKEKLSPRGIL